VFVQVENLGGTEMAVVDEEPCGGQDGVAGVVSGDVARRAVRGFVIGSGVAHQSHGVQVQEGWPTVSAYGISGRGRSGQGGWEVAAVRGEVGQSGAVGVGGFDPAGGCLGADADAVSSQRNSRGTSSPR
jgi:hypothetical protein